MRPIATIATFASLISGAALAQTTAPGMAAPQTTMPPAPTTQPPANPTMPPAPPAMLPAPATGLTSSGDMGTVPPRPSNWKGSDADWQDHVRKCQARSGYDAATDKYRTSSGQMRTCPR